MENLHKEYLNSEHEDLLALGLMDMSFEVGPLEQQ